VVSRRGPRLHVVLLAGGSGTRFWPLSRSRKPKQFLALAGREPLLLATWRRVRRLAPADRIWVVAPEGLKRDVRRVLPDLKRGRLIVEPSPRDTAPAVALACLAVARVDPQAIVGIFPTDHVIPDRRKFVDAVRVAAAAAAGGRGGLVCLGIKPSHPATGFGYLRCRARPLATRTVAVERFVEKPDVATAKRYLRSGKYLWNGGMFIWSVRRFSEELDRTAPRILRSVRAHLEGDSRAWGRATRLSVDYAVMENARGVQVVLLDAGWNDVGSWDAAAALREASGSAAGAILIDSPGSVIFGEERTVAVVDVPGVAVIDTPDALLVVSREGSEKVRRVVDELKRRGRKDLL